MNQNRFQSRGQLARRSSLGPPGRPQTPLRAGSLMAESRPGPRSAASHISMCEAAALGATPRSSELAVAPPGRLGTRPRTASSPLTESRAAKAAAATLLSLLHGLVRRRRARSCRGACWPRSSRWAGPATAVSSVRRTAPTRSRRAALLLISSTDAASSTSDAAGGRGTRHPSAVALLDGERARVEFVRSRGRSRARYCCSRRRGEPLRLRRASD